MKKIIAALIVLSSVNAFATVEWGNLKCNEIKLNDIDLLHKAMSTVEENNIRFVREDIAPLLEKRINKKNKIDQLHLESDVLGLENRAIEMHLGFLQFIDKCLEEKMPR
jgi:hypothetical protein